jgi:hypothetical protein
MDDDYVDNDDDGQTTGGLPKYSFCFDKKLHTCKPTFGRRGKVLYGETKGVPRRSNVWRFCYRGGSYI